MQLYVELCVAQAVWLQYPLTLCTWLQIREGPCQGVKQWAPPEEPGMCLLSLLCTEKEGDPVPSVSTSYP